jgi:hypothetical protein
MSTDINQLPNISQNIPVDDDDDAIQEVLAEIHNEQNPQVNNEPPQVPIETMQQLPPQPNNNNQFQMQQEMINNLQMELQNHKNNNNNKFIHESFQNNNSDTTSRVKMLLDNFQKDIKLYLAILISFIILQNDSISNLIINKLPNINIPYFNLVILGIIQVIIIIISQIFL